MQPYLVTIKTLHIVRQRICDYLADQRRITVEASLNLEKALHIGIEGFLSIYISNVLSVSELYRFY